MIDTSLLGKWPYLTNDAGISNDGEYIYYGLRNFDRSHQSLTVKSLLNKWNLEIENARGLRFSDDSKKAICLKNKDTLCIVTMANNSVEYISGVNSYTLLKDNKEWLIFVMNKPNKIVFRNLSSYSERAFDNAISYYSSKDNHVIVLKSKNNDGKTTLTLFKISTGESKVIYSGNNVKNCVFDNNGSGIAFTVEKTQPGQPENSIWYYQYGVDSAVELISNNIKGISQDRVIESVSGFTGKGQGILLTLKSKEAFKPEPDEVKVTIWNYADVTLGQKYHPIHRPYMAIFSFSQNEILPLEENNEFVWSTNFIKKDFLYLYNSKCPNTFFSSCTESPKSFLVSLSTGRKNKLAIDFLPQSILISPDDRYLIGLNIERADYFAYDTKTNSIRNLTRNIPVTLGKMQERDNSDRPYLSAYRGFYFEGWVSNSKILLHDEYDLWLVDLELKQKPRNITKGYGRKNKIFFRLLNKPGDKLLSLSSGVVLTAFNKNTKANGFYRLTLNNDSISKMEALTMNDCLYYDENDFESAVSIAPQKARDTTVYLILKQTAEQSPNYYYTTDFKRMLPVTDIHPEQQYNWLTSELITFKTLDKRTEKAILYKPEDFNPQKKYPVIIHYYERKTDGLHSFHPVFQRTGGHLDIPWFVSHGYLVCVPDIHYQTGEIGAGSLNSIAGVAQHLSRYSFVDSKKIGLEGYSFGGYETNFAISHSKLFAAAVTVSGLSDMISEYGTTLRGGNQLFFEREQMRMGVNLWQDPNRYIKNSPIFKAAEVSTPVLIMHNPKDGNVSFAQGVEWFMALRRLGKKSWMLQYDGETHGVNDNPKNIMDFLVKQTQFFDHYLKDAPAPKWMLDGSQQN